MKKLTLNQTWVLCLRMWKWIAKEWPKRKSRSVVALKEEWLEQHGYNNEKVRDNCFFCEYATQQQPITDKFCVYCPGRFVNKRFSCNNSSYHYMRKPVKFYRKLVQMDKKRRGK